LKKAECLYCGRFDAGIQRNLLPVILLYAVLKKESGHGNKKIKKKKKDSPGFSNFGIPSVLLLLLGLLSFSVPAKV
jgi:hypothetical protein